MAFVGHEIESIIALRRSVVDILSELHFGAVYDRSIFASFFPKLHNLAPLVAILAHTMGGRLRAEFIEPLTKYHRVVSDRCNNKGGAAKHIGNTGI